MIGLVIAVGLILALAYLAIAMRDAGRTVDTILDEEVPR